MGDHRTWRAQAVRAAVVLWLGLALAAAGPFGCGVPTPESLYIPMSDGTEIAADVWLPPGRAADVTVPTVLRLGRYWRDYQLPAALPPFIGKYIGNVDWLNAAGYAVLTVDVRGTGASFGVSTAPWSPEEVGDFPQLVDWVIAQPWSNGQVGAVGVSYEGVAADWLGAKNHPAVKAILPTYSYSDVYLDISHPGGIFNERFLKAWGDVTALMDRNDTSFLSIVAAANPHALLAVFADLASAALLGVRPITGAGSLLSDAIAQHENNPSVFDAARQIEFRDDLFETVTVDTVSPLLGAGDQRRTAAIRRVVGWPDAGTARGALSSFNTLDVPYHAVVIGPETHTGDYRADPYDFGAPLSLEKGEVIAKIWEAGPFFDAFLKNAGEGGAGREVRYYTYVERQWKQTSVWPPRGFEMQRWYFASDGRLSRDAPTKSNGEDAYTVDFTASTGLENRWFSGMSGVPIRYLDRAEQDQLLLVYETPEMTEDVELTGHPVVSLQVSSTHEDGAFYVYLEDAFPDGTVVYVTEGELRAIHRKVSNEKPPVTIFGPYHTFKRADAQPLVPGEVAEITFDLLPISTVIRAGHRIRVAIAGHDNDTFVRYPAEGTPVLRFQRNTQYASWIDLPLQSRGDLGKLPTKLPVMTPLSGALCPAASIVGLIGTLILLGLSRAGSFNGR
jgi:putative CocE/NonD family hydrolase